MEGNALKIKVCGMRDPVNIREVEALDVDMMGFIFYSKSPRYVSEMPAYLPAGCKKVGVFVNAVMEDVLARVGEYNLDVVQLHGDESPEYVTKLRKISPVSVFKALRLETKLDIDMTACYEGLCDGFVFDTPTKAYGGSGETFDWSILDHYRGDTPFLLSGGIGPDSLTAIEDFNHPGLLGLDLNSRFETAPALKNTETLKNFINAIKK